MYVAVRIHQVNECLTGERLPRMRLVKFCKQAVTRPGVECGVEEGWTRTMNLLFEGTGLRRKVSLSHSH